MYWIQVWLTNPARQNPNDNLKKSQFHLQKQQQQNSNI